MALIPQFVQPEIIKRLLQRGNSANDYFGCSLSLKTRNKTDFARRGIPPPRRSAFFLRHCRCGRGCQTVADHGDCSVLLQLAQPLFFLLALLRKILLTLFVLVVWLCQFVAFPAES